MNKKPKIAALTPGKDFVFFDPNKHIDMRRSNLPHWQQDNCLYFVTFRLADSIPLTKLRTWNFQHRSWLSRNPKPWSSNQAKEYLNHFKHKVEHWLDQSHGTCLLKNKELKKTLVECLEYHDGARYQIDSYVIAANHVHVLVAPRKGHSLSKILQTWKGISARKINRILKRSGKLWQKESYDHIVRTPKALEKIQRYISNHPI